MQGFISILHFLFEDYVLFCKYMDAWLLNSINHHSILCFLKQSSYSNLILIWIIRNYSLHGASEACISLVHCSLGLGFRIIALLLSKYGCKLRFMNLLCYSNIRVWGLLFWMQICNDMHPKDCANVWIFNDA